MINLYLCVHKAYHLLFICRLLLVCLSLLLVLVAVAVAAYASGYVVFVMTQRPRSIHLLLVIARYVYTCHYRPAISSVESSATLCVCEHTFFSFDCLLACLLAALLFITAFSFPH